MFIIALIVCVLTLVGYFLFFRGAPAHSECSDNVTGATRQSSGAATVEENSSTAEQVLTVAEKKSEPADATDQSDLTVVNQEKEQVVSCKLAAASEEAAVQQPEIVITGATDVPEDLTVEFLEPPVTGGETAQTVQEDLTIEFHEPTATEGEVTAQTVQSSSTAAAAVIPDQDQQSSTEFPPTTDATIADESFQHPETETAVVVSEASAIPMVVNEVTTQTAIIDEHATATTFHVNEASAIPMVVNEVTAPTAVVNEVTAPAATVDEATAITMVVSEVTAPTAIVDETIAVINETTAAVSEATATTAVVNEVTAPKIDEAIAIVIVDEAVAPAVDEATGTTALVNETTTLVNETTSIVEEHQNIEVAAAAAITTAQDQVESEIQNSEPEPELQMHPDLVEAPELIEEKSHSPNVKFTVGESSQADFSPNEEFENRVMNEFNCTISANSQKDISSKTTKENENEISSNDISSNDISSNDISSTKQNDTSSTSTKGNDVKFLLGDNSREDLSLNEEINLRLQKTNNRIQSSPVRCPSKPDHSSSLTKIVEFECEDMSLTPQNDDWTTTGNDNSTNDSWNTGHIVEANDLTEKPKLTRQETMYESAEVVTFVSR
jgi:hypothetical protein